MQKFFMVEFDDGGLRKGFCLWDGEEFRIADRILKGFGYCGQYVIDNQIREKIIQKLIELKEETIKHDICFSFYNPETDLNFCIYEIKVNEFIKSD